MAALQLTKERLGITSTIRDELINTIVEGVQREMKELHGLSLDLENPRHLMFVVDLSVWRYQSRDQSNAMPRNLQYRLHNMMIADRSVAE